MAPDINAYGLVIGASVIVIISYFFNVLSNKTNIPSVLLLIALGMAMKQGLHYAGVDDIPYLNLVLELLGTIGLIFIVLEAALDLELSPEKWPLIWKSFTVALLALMLSTFSIAGFLHLFIIDDWAGAFVYAMPLSIMSSAIIIPSVGGLKKDQKEFMVYESTFSDILGIMFFYLFLQNVNEISSGAVVGNIFASILGTIVLSVVFCYALTYVLLKVRTGAKLFLTIAVLLLLYALGKTYHLSPLILILAFGLMINNSRLFWRGKLSRFVENSNIEVIRHEFHLLTLESSFVIRTFFFVIFGFSIVLSSLFNIEVVFFGLIVALLLYLMRWFSLILFVRKDIFPLLYIAPRGLITILLFFAIPVEFKSESFDNGILLVVIFATSLIMTFSLIQNGFGVKPVLSSELHTSEGISSEKIQDSLLGNPTEVAPDNED